MTQDKQKHVAFRIGSICVSIAAVLLLLLVGDWVVDILQAPAKKSRLEALEQRVNTDAAVAQSLEEERERQTDLSLARKNRSRLLAWLLLMSATGFVVAGQRYVALSPRSQPAFEALVAERFGLPSPTERRTAVPGRGAPVADAASIDLAPVDDLVARFGSGREAAILILQGIQRHYRYLPDAALLHLCERTEITAAQIAGTSSFYAQFRRSPVGRHVVRICHGTACHVVGATQITNELRRHLGIPPDEDTDAPRMFTLEVVACVGCCSLAPVIMVEDRTAGRLTPASARGVLEELGSSS